MDGSIRQRTWITSSKGLISSKYHRRSEKAVLAESDWFNLDVGQIDQFSVTTYPLCVCRDENSRCHILRLLYCNPVNAYPGGFGVQKLLPRLMQCLGSCRARAEHLHRHCR